MRWDNCWGIRTPCMTQRYAHLLPQFMAGAVGKLDGIMGGMLPEVALQFNLEPKRTV